MSDPGRTPEGHQALLDRLLAALTAESLDRLLAEGAGALAALAGASAAGAFLVEGDRVIAEGLFGAPGADPGSFAPRLRSLALECVRHGGPVRLPEEAGAAAQPYGMLLAVEGRTFGAACVLAPRGADTSPPLERAARIVAEAIDARRRRESERAVARQQERWFRQLDRQVRVLDRERQKFAAVTNQCDTYVYVTDSTGTIRWVNRAMTERWHPGAAGSWLGRSCRDVCSRFGPERAIESCRSCPVRRALETNAAVHHELREVANGRTSTLYLSALPIHGLDGRAQEALVMIQDLTDLETLRDSEERYRVVTQGASDGILSVNEDGRIIFANEAVERIFGWAPAELIGQPLTRIMPPDHAARHRLAFERYVRTGEHGMGWSGVQMPGRHRSGREVLLEMSFGESMRDGRRLITGVMRDVTERRRAEIELEHARMRLQMVVSSSPIVMFAVDRDGVFTLSEGRGLASLGLQPGQVVGQSAFAIYAGVPRIVDALRRALAGEELVDEVEVAGLVFECRYTPARDERGAVTGVIGVAFEITERRRLEAQLRQSQKLEDVGRLAGGVAHEFNNLLTTILGYCSILIGRANGPAPDPRLAAIQTAAERGAALTRQLLAFSRKQVFEPRVSDLNRVVPELAAMLRRVIGEDVELEVAAAAEPAHVLADPGQIEQALLNLVVNAREAMPRGGQVRIEVGRRDLDAPLRLGTVRLAPGPWVTLAVRDTGVGMDGETLARAFEPFFTRKEHGSGLGLAIVHGLLEQLGGRIVAESEPGAGSRFTLYLPRVDAAPESVAAPRARRGGGETVLLVEDEAPVRALVREILEGEGYQVLEADGGAGALAAAAAHPLPIHLLVTDVVMPGMGGGELAERMRQERPGLRVLFMSGYMDDAVARHGVVRAESALLPKPFTQEVIVARVREALDRPEPPQAAEESRRAA